MSNSTESETFCELTYSSESRFGVWAWFAQEENDTPKQPEGSGD